VRDADPQEISREVGIETDQPSALGGIAENREFESCCDGETARYPLDERPEWFDLGTEVLMRESLDE
jgi:hypothetical protein